MLHLQKLKKTFTSADLNDGESNLRMRSSKTLPSLLEGVLVQLSVSQ